MDFRTLLRAALIPLGASLVMRGLSDLRAEADELADLVDARRAYLAGDGPLPEVDEPPAADDDEHQAAAPDPEQLEDYRITGNGNPVTRRPRRWPLWAVLGIGVGYVAARASVELAARAQFAAAESADITAALMRQPPAPGSPADLAAPVPLPEPCADPCTRAQLCTYPLCSPEREHQGADEPAGEADPFACRDCPYVPLESRSAAQRGVDLSLHRNRLHRSAGLPGR